MFKFLTSGLRATSNATSFREFHGLLNSKNRKKNFKPFWSYIDFVKVLKKSEKSKYLSKY
jgi:hypothetical protein